MQRALSSLRIQTAALSFSGSSPFAGALEAAAGRAWMRRVSSRASHSASGGAAPPPPYGAVPQSHRKGGKGGVYEGKTHRPSSAAAELDHDSGRGPAKTSADSLPSDSRVVERDIPLPFDAKTSVPHHSEATVPADPTPALPQEMKSSLPFLPFPASTEDLNANLIFASQFRPIPNVEDLINYHDAYPHLQSTETYNTSIHFAIHLGEYHVANRLFGDLNCHGEIDYDDFTYQLLVQLYAHQFADLGRETWDRPILRRGSSSVKELLSIIRDPDPEIRGEVFLRRILECLQPMLSGWEVHPKVVKAALYSMIQRELFSAAAELANVYFCLLPADINEEVQFECLEIIHILLSIDVKRGLFSFYPNQRLLIALLQTHPSFEPSPDTLQLLLAPLSKAKKCGTVAFNVVKAFTKKYGDGVLNEGVRRRVAKLAAKEGRSDIIMKMSNQSRAR